MIKFQTIDFDSDNIDKDSLFIGVFGYETRSSYIFSLLEEALDPQNVLMFQIETVPKYSIKIKKDIANAKKLGVCIEPVDYYDTNYFISRITSFIEHHIKKSASISDVNIDYSSLPRDVYCRLPFYLSKNILPTSISYNYWYSEAKYINTLDEFPTSGIKNLYRFSGNRSLGVNKGRTHIFGIGYDNIRTTAIQTTLDPSPLITCFSYKTGDENIVRRIKSKNSIILNQSSQYYGFPIEDFSTMLYKLTEITYESYIHDDVVLVPDGPKPLILAMSLVPDILNKVGVIALHIRRNINKKSCVDAIPKEAIHGFSVNNDDGVI